MCSCRHKFCENNDPKEIIEHIPATEKMISMIKKERTTNSYLHIYVNCLCLFTFYVGHIIYSYLHSGKQTLSDRLFRLIN